ncbi:uncharacterized protein LOC101556935 isoform X2 [Sorex araneus]|uniref:uncharacterized protein LOC101556935 isoform X2 n=1 Tax=Sorex araneus TaxID=42254 RepID=UPI002433C374|nr:uncharacterized protein LOC101556935 isoform X2 [Sorex araneus]
MTLRAGTRASSVGALGLTRSTTANPLLVNYNRGSAGTPETGERSRGAPAGWSARGLRVSRGGRQRQPRSEVGAEAGAPGCSHSELPRWVGAPQHGTGRTAACCPLGRDARGPRDPAEAHLLARKSGLPGSVAPPNPEPGGPWSPEARPIRKRRSAQPETRWSIEPGSQAHPEAPLRPTRKPVSREPGSQPHPEAGAGQVPGVGALVSPARAAASGMYMQVESRSGSCLHLTRAPGARSWSLLVGILSIGLAAAYYSGDSLGWKLFYVMGCLFVAVQNLEDWEEAIFNKNTGKVVLKTFSLYRKLLTFSRAGHDQVVVLLHDIRDVNVEEEKVRYFGKGYVVVLRFATGFSHPLTQSAVMGHRSDVEAIARLIVSFLELHRLESPMELSQSSDSEAEGPGDQR